MLNYEEWLNLSEDEKMSLTDAEILERGAVHIGREPEIERGCRIVVNGDVEVLLQLGDGYFVFHDQYSCHNLLPAFLYSAS